MCARTYQNLYICAYLLYLKNVFLVDSRYTRVYSEKKNTYLIIIKEIYTLIDHDSSNDHLSIYRPSGRMALIKNIQMVFCVPPFHSPRIQLHTPRPNIRVRPSANLFGTSCILFGVHNGTLVFFVIFFFTLLAII